jgi:cysteine desulfurase
VSVVVAEADGASIVVKLDLQGLAGSVGSACTTGSTEPSHVLSAMGYPDEEARGSLRLSLGRTTTEAEIEAAIEIVPRILAESRAAATILAADPLGQAVAS